LELIKILPTDDPSKISHIDIKTSIVLCVTENNTNILLDDKSITLINPSDISFSSQRILTNNYTIINYSPNIRWSIPNDINITFKEALAGKEKSYFGNIYISIPFNVPCDSNTLISYAFSIYVDRSRSKEMGKIRKGDRLLDVGFDYKIFAETIIDKIYVIWNNYCFQEFEMHFSK